MSSKFEQGSTLLEALVALFILAVGMLGMLALQTKSIQFNQSAFSYTQAVFLANDIAERIHRNPGLGASYLTANIPSSAPAQNCNTSACNPSQLALWDMYSIAQNTGAALPGGKITFTQVTFNSLPFVQITIHFDDSRAVQDLAAQTVVNEDGEEEERYVPAAIKEYSLMVEI